MEGSWHVNRIARLAGVAVFVTVIAGKTWPIFAEEPSKPSEPCESQKNTILVDEKDFLSPIGQGWADFSTLRAPDRSLISVTLKDVTGLSAEIKALACFYNIEKKALFPAKVMVRESNSQSKEVKLTVETPPADKVITPKGTEKYSWGRR